MKNLKKKLKKAFKLNKKTNKVKNEPTSSISIKNNNISAETKTVKLFIKKDLNVKLEASNTTKKLEEEEAKQIIDEPKEQIIPEPTEQQAKERNQLDKRERMEMYKKSLLAKPAASSINEAFDLINNTLIEVEEKYGPHIDNKTFYFSKRYGRMFPLSKDKLKFNAESGKNEMITVGFTIYINKNGSFEFWSKNPKEPKLILSKSGGCLINNHQTNTLPAQIVI